MKYSVIGDNTQENREWLEKVGYKLNYIYNDEGVVYTRCDINSYYVGLLGNIKVENIINCIGNSPSFKAVSAMRDDSDYMQWFVIDEDIKHKEEYIFKKGEFVLSTYPIAFKTHQKAKRKGAHKASLSELQEKFK